MKLKISNKIKSVLAVAILTIFTFSEIAEARIINTADIAVPEGYKIELAADSLSAPTMVAFDGEGNMLVAESGYGGSGDAKITRIDKEGLRKDLTAPGVFGDELPVTAVAYHQNTIYAVHAGTVSIVLPSGTLKRIITGLPGKGDHQANQLVFKDGKMYLGIGTVTNSGVVGPDNAVFGWLTKPQNRNLSDVPCRDITLAAGSTFESGAVAGHSLPRAVTSPYMPFGKVQPAGKVIKGNVKCNGAILTANLNGTGLQVYAWGLRNPYGLEIGPDGELYASMHGFDARGSRPIENAPDCLYKIEEGAWYGFPDFACDIPVTDPQFKPVDKPQPQFILGRQPTSAPPTPIAKFDPHAAANGFDFALEGWGKPTDIFMALFGDFTPATGALTEPRGVKIVRVDAETGQITDFINNKVPGQASKHSAGGLEHPSDVEFGPDGAMYIADWGVANITVDGLTLEPDSGVIWKVSKLSESAEQTIAGQFVGPSMIAPLIGVILLLALSIFIGRGKKYYSLGEGFIDGILAGAVMGVAAVAISRFIMNLPFDAPTRLFASMIMGEAALANILEFNFMYFLIGLVIVLGITAILGYIFSLIGRAFGIKQFLSALAFSLAVWMLVQYFAFPLLFPIIIEKGFPPVWFAVTFGIFGLALGLFSNFRRAVQDPDEL